MNRSAVGLLVIAATLAVALAAVLLDGSRARSDGLARELAAVTGLPDPAWSVGWLEPRCRVVLDDAGDIHPGLEPPRTLDFAHGR